MLNKGLIFKIIKSLEKSAEIPDLNPNEVNPMNDVTQVKANSEKQVQVTEAANKHILQCLTKNAHYKGIRLQVKKTGCSGLSYVVDYVETPEPDDLAFPQATGYTIFIAKKSYPFLKGISIDYIKEGLNSKFSYHNPNQTGSCGCGESFTID